MAVSEVEVQEQLISSLAMISEVRQNVLDDMQLKLLIARDSANRSGLMKTKFNHYPLDLTGNFTRTLDIVVLTV
jgi:hypothetical protein